MKILYGLIAAILFFFCEAFYFMTFDVNVWGEAGRYFMISAFIICMVGGFMGDVLFPKEKEDKNRNWRI